MTNDTRRKGLLRRIFGGLWALVDATRRLALNLLFLAIVGVLVAAWVASGPPALKEKSVLVLDLSGRLVEQAPGDRRSAIARQLVGEDRSHTRLRDILAALDAGAKDPRITSALLMPEELSGGGPAALHEVAAAIDRFRAAGKKVVAWGTAYDQRQYSLAAHADEVYLHPMGTVSMQGYGRLRNYWRDAFDRVGISPNVIRAGKFKNAGETFSDNAPSKETLESEQYLFDALWQLYTADVEKARKLPEGRLMTLIDGLPAAVRDAGGDIARLAVDVGLVDGLKTRDELRALLTERGARDDKSKSFRQVRLHAYLGHVKPPRGDAAVGIVVAEGEISDGDAPPGRVGGRSTADLIRKAREDDKVKAVVLRVNSPGGSALGAELVRRELEVTRAAGKPVVVSMGDLAASGGYWISMAADEVIADPATVTGSIGVVGLLPTADRLLDKLSVRSGGYTTTWLGTAYDPRRPLDPRLADIVQSAIGHVYRDFTTRVAAARQSTPAKIDEVAQGRVWTGAQAKDRGLVDRTGSWNDALQAARARAGLADDAALQWFEREPGRLDRLLGFLGEGALRAAALLAGAHLDVLGALALVPGAGEELQWLAEIAQRRAPFAAVVHCLCEAED
jgi:protease-4